MQAEAGSIRTLPGLLKIAGMERTTVDLGRCQVCTRGKAVWRDEEAGVVGECYHIHAKEAVPSG